MSGPQSSMCNAAIAASMPAHNLLRHPQRITPLRHRSVADCASGDGLLLGQQNCSSGERLFEALAAALGGYTPILSSSIVQILALSSQACHGPSMRHNAPGLRQQRTIGSSNPFVMVSPYLRHDQLRSAIAWALAAKTTTECQLDGQALYTRCIPVSAAAGA